MRLLQSIIAFLLALASLPVAAATSLVERLQSLAPDADARVITLAVDAMQCAVANGMPASERLAVIDYSLPSTTPRLWVFDLSRSALLFHELVAHGRNSGENLTTHFSNMPGSLATSIGLFRTGATYKGSNGYSLRMEGLEPGVNDKAMERAIVMHGAPYVREGMAEKFGRLGRSWGCPAVRQGVAKRLIDTMKEGQFLFSYYPDQQWLGSSPFLNCTPKTASR
ncbi:MAG: murein L,D-transpeptidase catalytic domain family protein [Pedobacter sp.]|nr:murein L,D-transpeptidase catalytic domain family protein [Pedobacter sp.]